MGQNTFSACFRGIYLNALYLVQLKTENEEQKAVILKKSGEINALSSKLEATQDKLEKDAEYRDEEAIKLTAKFEAKTGILNNLIQSLKTEVAESDKRAAKLNQELETPDETHKNKISELTTFNEKWDVDEKRSVLFEQESLSFKSDSLTDSKQVLERGNLLKAGLAAAKLGKNGEKSEQNEKSKIQGDFF